jgi:Tol biopolymer transport system component
MARVNDLNPILLVEKAIANDTEQYTWSPDGRRIAYVDQRAVKLLNLETRSVTSYNSGSPAMSDPVFDEAGNLGILMNTNLFGNSVALEGDLEQVKRLTPNDRPYLRVVEKDGKSFNLIQQPSALVEPSLIIPYIFRPGGEVYLNIGGIDRKITPPAYLPDSSPNCLDAILSPDRGKVLVSCMGTKVRLFVYEIAADKRYDLGEIAQPSSWSPDSEDVLYQLEISDGHAVDWNDLYVVHYTGGRRVKIARAKGTVYGASWGRDGLIAYDEEGKIILGKITMN